MIDPAGSGDNIIAHGSLQQQRKQKKDKESIEVYIRLTSYHSIRSLCIALPLPESASSEICIQPPPSTGRPSVRPSVNQSEALQRTGERQSGSEKKLVL